MRLPWIYMGMIMTESEKEGIIEIIHSVRMS